MGSFFFHTPTSVDAITYCKNERSPPSSEGFPSRAWGPFFGFDPNCSGAPFRFGQGMMSVEPAAEAWRAAFDCAMLFAPAGTWAAEWIDWTTRWPPVHSLEGAQAKLDPEAEKKPGPEIKLSRRFAHGHAGFG